jgi:epoxyqueuosine reductase
MGNLAEIINKTALSLGFFDCGFVKIGEIDEIFRSHFDIWLKNGYNANMRWIEKNIEIRFNPKLLLENAKTAVVVLHSHSQQVTPENKTARFALQDDYHKIIRKKLKLLCEKIAETSPETKTRICVDSAPILEKYWAAKAGLGFIGANTLFISNKIGSFCNIGILLLDCGIETKTENLANESFCETCGNCINSCPTKALVSPYTLDCNKCISYQTIYRNDEKFDCFGWEYGCDICQEVCPFND